MAKTIKLTLTSYAIKTSLLLSLSSVAIAATDYEVDTIVVTASGFEQQLKNAPATISVITKEELQDKQVNDLAEALENIEGIDVRGNTGKTGGLNISIRGMPSKYTLVLIDGRRQSDTDDVTPNGFGAMQTNFIPPVSAIERIEVIKGPMSTLYGSDAMGGVINIITKKVGTQWNGSVKVDHTFQEDRDSGDQSNLSLYTSGPIIEDKVGLVLRSSVFHRQESLRENNEGVLLSTRGYNPVKSTVYSLGGRVNFSPNNQHDIWLDVDTARQKYDNSNNQLGTLGAGSKGGYKDTLRFSRDQFALGYTRIFDLGTWESSLMYKQTENKGRVIPNLTGVTHVGEGRKVKAENIILDSKFIASIADVHQLTVGGQWWDAKVEDGLITKGKGGNKFKQKTYAAFVEDEWSLTDSLALTGGMRYDHHEVFGNYYNPRAYLVWNTTDHITIKGGVGKGYKAPTLAQTHDGLSGVSGQGSIAIIGNKDLKPEKSTNYELGIMFDNQNDFNLGATTFFNKFKNKIESKSISTNEQTYHNINEADIYGLEFSSKYNFIPQLALNLKYTYTHSEQKSGKNEGMPLNNTPKHMASAKLDWRINEDFSSWLQVIYRGKSDRFSTKPQNLTGDNKDIYETLGSDLKQYAVVNLGGRYNLNKQVSFAATIYNLLDKDFTKYGSFYSNKDSKIKYVSYYVGDNGGTILEGRRLWLSANIDF